MQNPENFALLLLFFSRFYSIEPSSLKSMFKKFLIPFALLFVIAILGCKEEETGPNSPSEFLTHKVWDGGKWTYTYTIRGIQLIDSTKTIPDVRVTFSPDGNYSANPPFRFMRANGKWKLSEDGKKITLDNDAIKGSFEIEKLDIKDLILKQELNTTDPVLGAEVKENATITLQRK